MPIKLVDVRTPRDRKRWVRFPYTHYRRHPFHVPQLYGDELAYFDPGKNPAFDVCDVRLFLAERDGQVVGRVCGLVNSLETEKLGRKRGRFGWFESIDDQEVAHGLLNAVRSWHESTGCVEMTGPHGFTDLDVEGLLLDGFDCIPTVAGAYNHPYYAELVESFGMVKDVDYFDCRFRVPEGPGFIDRVGGRAEASGAYHVRPVRGRKAFLGQVNLLWPVLEKAFEPLYGVTPLTPAQQAYYTKKYFGFLDPELFVFVYSAAGEMVAFLAAMPNISKALRKAGGRLLPFGFLPLLKDMKHPETVDFLLAGSLPGHPTGPITAVGLKHMFEVLRRRGVSFVEGNHQLEDNVTIHQMWNRFGMVSKRRSRIYRMPLQGKDHPNGAAAPGSPGFTAVGIIPREAGQGMSVKITEVTTRAELKRWVGFPYDHYRGDPLFVPPLAADELAYFDRKRNPAFEVCEARLFLAEKNGRTAGRICGLVNRLETEKLGLRRGRFGWFESVPDPEVGHRLLAAVSDWHRSTGCAEMTGPHGFTDLDIEGLLVEGFDSLPTVAGAYNPPYYADLMTTFGLRKDVDYLDYRFRVPEDDGLLARLGRRAQSSGKYHVQPVRGRKAFLACVNELWPVLEASFRDLYGVVPLTAAQQAYYTKKYFGFLDPEFFAFIRSRSGELVAFLAAMPNISGALQKANGRLLPTGWLHLLRDLKRPGTVDFLLAGALPGHPGSLLTALGLEHIFTALRQRGVSFVETNHELEHNTSVNQLWQRFDIVATRRSRIYRMALSD